MAIAPPRERSLEELAFANSFAALGEAFSEHRTPDGNPGRAPRRVQPRRSRADRPAARRGTAPGVRCARRAATRSCAAWSRSPRCTAATSSACGPASSATDARSCWARCQTPDGPWELQIKGGGITAFSRFADGRAVVRSTVREFLASEAMYHLGIPTTRALAMAAGDEPVLRERVERAATVIRMAPSFVRFGSFEIFHYRKQHDHVKTLADYVIDRFFPECASGDDRYARFFATVVERTATLMAAWQAVGFAHGVMNTDNFSILGLTLDYGPYGFSKRTSPASSATTRTRRAATRSTGSRRSACGTATRWAKRSRRSSRKTRATSRSQDIAPAYRSAFLGVMRDKLGLRDARDDDADLVLEAFRMLETRRVDWTNFWRALSHDDARALALLGDDASSRAWFDALPRARGRGRPRRRGAPQRRCAP